MSAHTAAALGREDSAEAGRPTAGRIIDNAGIAYTAPFEHAIEAKARYVKESA